MPTLQELNDADEPEALRMLDGYAEAELVAARTAAAKMGFIVQGPDAETDPDAPQRTGGPVRCGSNLFRRASATDLLRVAWFASADPFR